MHYKLRHPDEWEELPKPRVHRGRDHREEQHNELLRLYNEKRPIAEKKFKSLQELKLVMPMDYHAFYDNLKH